MILAACHDLGLKKQNVNLGLDLCGVYAGVKDKGIDRA